MHSTRQQNPIKTLRKLCGLTQVELAEILDCARLTVNSLESGKLKLSHKMAEKFALHTGVSKAWLLANNARSKPVCQRDPTAAFSRQAFERVRAEIERERTSPGELMAVSSYVEQYCAELRDCASTAVQTGDTTYFYYKLREFLSELKQRWPGCSPDGLTTVEFAHALRKRPTPGPKLRRSTDIRSR
jgi:DNA-binding XRE family transcriptional regulator